MKWVEERQKSKLLGIDSTLLRMVAPVVVYPETLSNNELITENGPPHRAYGNIPNIKDNIQDRKIIMYPSCNVIASVFRTKMKGNIPTRKVIRQLMAKAARALSFPVGLEMDTNTEKNMNNALTKRAKPTFLDITLTFISNPVYLSLESSFFTFSLISCNRLRSIWLSSIISVIPSFNSVS
jgi:hypothetical protein